MNVKTKYAKLQAKLAIALGEMIILQETCPHVDLSGEYDSNNGNWCSSDDSYWLHLHCNDCSKVWNIDSDNPEYRTTKFKEKK